MNRPSADRDMEQLVRSWLREDEGYPADRNRQIGRIMGRSDETRQRRGPWRFLPFWRRGTATDPHDDELLPARPDGIASVAAGRTGVAPLAATVVAVLALVVLSLTFVRLDGQLAFGPGASASPSPTPTPKPIPPVGALGVACLT